MDQLLVSMMRFSTAVTLFGIQQMESAMNTVTGSENFKDSLDKFRTALDDFSEAVGKEIDKGKRETLDSITRACEDTLKRAMDGMNENMTDPREALNTAADMMKKATDSLADWMNLEKSSKSSDSTKDSA
jgi:hypothetical protein